MNLIQMFKQSFSALHTSIITRSIQPIKSLTTQIQSDSKGIADMVLGGIMIAILGFAMIFIGLYVTFVIRQALPIIPGGNAYSAAQNASSAAYNSTAGSLESYAATVFPVLGLALLIIGFAIIFVALRSGMGGMGTGR